MRLAILLCLSLAACAEFPELDGTITPEQASGDFPALVPLAPLLARADASDNGAALIETALSPRIANLRTRAAGLRGPVIPAPARARMLRGVR
ncbi:MAG: hypothetical protein ACSHWY_10305 [Octadecabacter sp.]